MTLHALFAAQAARSPHAIAVADPERRLSYAELDALANRCAAALADRGAGPGHLVAVRMEHGAALLAAMLGVLKAGPGYVPIDPLLPQRRQQRLIDAAGCELVLDELPGADGPPPADGAGPDDVAYVMFTSGSTGEPKGVVVPHRAVTNYLSWCGENYVGDGNGSMAHSSIAFDLTVTSLFLPLITGRTVHLDPAWRDPFALGAALDGCGGLDLLKVTPSHLEVLNHASGRGFAGTTYALVVGGEALTHESLRPWTGHARIFNEYGPTEAAVGCCVHEVTDGAAGPVPIGRAIAGTSVHVLDRHLEPVPVGVPGEIHIGGAGLAHGYLGSPGLTAGAFVPDPFASAPGARLYRTGDLAHRAADGELVYLGRIDEQAKVRGVRLEPEEIRTALREHPGVRDAVVVAVGDVVAAHLVAVAAPVPDAELRAFAADRLPHWLVPDTYAWHAEIPLTGNGKIDRAALTRPRGPASDRVVVRAMEDLLGRVGIGPDDDFFALGGHSLLAVRLVARLSRDTGRDIPVSALFDRPPTPRSLAALLGDDDWQLVPEPAVLLAPGTGEPLVFVDPAGAGLACYRDLAAALGPPVHGLPAGEPSSVEDLAKRHLAAVGRPAIVVGWSAGGLVAFELGRLLGKTTVVLLDTYLDITDPLMDAPAVHRAHVDAARVYCPQPSTASVVLIQAAAENAGERHRAAEQWRERCVGEFTHHVLPGDHFSMLHPPCVGELARIVNALV